MFARTKMPLLVVRLLARLRAQQRNFLDLSPLAAGFMQPHRMPDQWEQSLSVFVLVLMIVSMRMCSVLSKLSIPIDTPEHLIRCLVITPFHALRCRSDAQTLYVVDWCPALSRQKIIMGSCSPTQSIYWLFVVVCISLPAHDDESAVSGSFLVRP